MRVSKYFSRNQLFGLLKAGDVILPGTDVSPSFSRIGCIDHVDRMAAYLSSDDLFGLRMLLKRRANISHNINGGRGFTALPSIVQRSS